MSRLTCRPWCGLPYGDIRVPSLPAHIDNRIINQSQEAWLASPGWCSALCRDRRYPPLPVPAKVAPMVHPLREAGQRWMAADGRELTLSAECPWSNRPDAWIDTAGRLWWSWTTMTLISPAPVAKPAETMAKERRCPNCGESYDDANTHCPSCGTKQIAAAKPPVAQGAKCCGPMSLHGGGVAERFIKNYGTGYVESRRLCDTCYLRTEPSGGGSDVLHNDKHPDRLPKAQAASDYYDDCLEEAGR